MGLGASFVICNPRPDSPRAKSGIIYKPIHSSQHLIIVLDISQHTVTRLGTLYLLFSPKVSTSTHHRSPWLCATFYLGSRSTSGP